MKTPKPPKIIAPMILDLLAAKHRGDVFVAECKTGPTTTANAHHLRMDAWVMRRSWAHPDTTGYEIKVSRGDFLRDDKWPAYLKYCNRFYFVCPPNMIAVNEVPAGCGLMWASKNAAMLYTKIKAPRREVEIPENLWRYVLMCRASIQRAKCMIQKGLGEEK